MNITKSLTILSLVFVSNLGTGRTLAVEAVDFQVLQEFSVGHPIGKLRAVPVQLGRDKSGILLAYSADKEIDPYIEMFYPPTDKMKLTLVDLEGNTIWHRELGSGVINGIWFTPIFPMDLDQDGVDEIWFVNNTDPVHIFAFAKTRLESLDAVTGETLGHWKWKRAVWGSQSETFRNFILGGFVDGSPVLITAQGTYGDMRLQAWNPNMEQRWDLRIGKSDKGARGSHMCPVVDIDHDGNDELLWGERCIRINDGTYKFIADENVYRGHSDVIQPTLNRKENRWYVFTCRESGDKGEIKPRVVMFDDHGKRVWTDLEMGHMDMGWTAHTGSNGEVLAFTISRGDKVAGPDGFFRKDVVEYAYEAFQGNKVTLPFKAYNTVPVDVNGDGIHEYLSALGEQADRKLYALNGSTLGSVGEKGYVAMASKFLEAPGEQILCYYPDGTIKIWGDQNAKDNKLAMKRYSNPYYKKTQKLTAVGWNLASLGGL